MRKDFREGYLSLEENGKLSARTPLATYPIKILLSEA